MPDEPTAEGVPKPPEEQPQQPAATPPKPAVPAARPAAPAAAKPATPPAPKPPPVMPVNQWEGELPDALKQAFGDRISGYFECVGQCFVEAVPSVPVAILEFLRDSFGFEYLVDITAVDYPKKPERFELIYIVYSYARNERIRIKTRIGDGYKPETATTVYATADWLEREVFDMFGIEFEGHPNMKRILLPDEWTGYPLRKDYGILQMDNRWVQENLGIESGQ